MRLLEPRIGFSFHVVDVGGIRIVIAEIERAANVPVRFQGLDYIRVGSVTRPLRDAPPRTRNEAMAAVMRRVGICEERGSGIDKVMAAIELAQLPAPLFETPPGATRVAVFARRNLRNMSRADRVRAVYQHACLRYVMGEQTSNATLRERFGISGRNAAAASRLLGEALEAGMIVVQDPEAGTRRRSYLPFWAAPPANRSR